LLGVPEADATRRVSELPLRLTAWSLLAGTATALPPPKHASRGLAFAPTNGALAAVLQRHDCKDYVSILACSDWQVGARWACATSDAEDVLFCGDSCSLALWDAGGVVVLHSLEGDVLGRFSPETPLGTRSCVWSPDCSLLAAASYGTSVSLLDATRVAACAELQHSGCVRGPPSLVAYREAVDADAPQQPPGAAAPVRYALAACPVTLPTLKGADKAAAKLGVGEHALHLRSRSMHSLTRARRDAGVER
jgi:hypothetical protein